jgi:hypothetical protein
MTKRTSRRNRGNRKKAASSFKLDTFSVSEGNHPKFRALMHEAASVAVADYPQTLATVKDQLQHHDPIGIIACFTGYSLVSSLSKDGSHKTPFKDIQQHHAELLQAIILTIPPDNWGFAPVVPGVMQIVFDSLPKLSDSFFLQRTLDTEKITDGQEIEVRSLQERIRLHTQAVRNWGHFGAVVRISKDLYGAIDTPFAAHHGFSCTAFIEVMHCAVKEFERRQTEHWNRFRNVMRGRNPRQIFRLYFKNVPGLVGSAEDMLAALPGIDMDGAKAAVMAHYDLRLAECGSFKPEEIAKLSGHASQVVESVFRAVSLAPGALADAKPEYLFLDNPVWQAPAVDRGSSFFLPMPQAVFSHIHRIMDRLAGIAGLKKEIETARSRYLEEKLETTFRSALPGAAITSGAKWKIGDQEFETDVLVVLDHTVIVAEAKSNRLTPEGLRGAPARVKRHVQDMVLAPSVQSERLASIITKAQSGDTASIAIVTGLGINPETVDRIIRLSVTLDDLSVLSAAEEEFKKVDWIPQDHELAPTILIADLLCIVDILEKPLLLLHYLSERMHFQKDHHLLGDELDFLGLYLENGFNFVLPAKDMLFVTAGMSAPIDRYYDSLDAGISRAKPRPSLSSLFGQIVDRLNERRPNGWTTVGLHLLSAASPAEQRRVEKSLDKLRREVRKSYRNPEHINTMQIEPPQERKARVGFYLFPEQLRSKIKSALEQLANQALDTDGVEAIVLFARSTERWDVPYEAVLYAKKR